MNREIAILQIESFPMILIRESESVGGDVIDLYIVMCIHMFINCSSFKYAFGL